jgi:hypothetical protein
VDTTRAWPRLAEGNGRLGCDFVFADTAANVIDGAKIKPAGGKHAPFSLYPSRGPLPRREVRDRRSGFAVGLNVPRLCPGCRGVVIGGKCTALLWCVSHVGLEIFRLRPGPSRPLMSLSEDTTAHRRQTAMQYLLHLLHGLNGDPFDTAITHIGGSDPRDRRVREEVVLPLSRRSCRFKVPCDILEVDSTQVMETSMKLSLPNSDAIL